MALLERLQILIDADGKGAVREFQRVGDAAGKAADTADDRFKKMGSTLTTFGAGAVTASAVAAVGLGKLATTASDYGEAISASSVIFEKEAVPALEAYGEAAADASGLSKTAAVDGANTFGAFGKAAGLAGDDLVGFSTDLVTLAGDMASFKNTTPEEAIEAIGAALRGESEPIRKYNVLLDDATLKQEAMALGIYDGNGALTQQQKVLAANASIFKQTNDIQGDYLRTSDSLANRQRNLAAEFDNLKIKIGEGLVPIFETLSGAASSAFDGFDALPEGAQSAAGAVAGIGAAAGIATGGVSLLAGFALRSVDTFRDLGSRMRDAEGNSTRLSRSMRGLAVGAGVVAGVLALDAALDAASVSAVDLDTNLNNIKGARSANEALSVLIERTRIADGFWADLQDTFGGDDLGALANINGVTVDLNNLKGSLEDLRNSGDTEALRLALEGLRGAAISEAGTDWLSGATGGAEGVDRLNGLLDEYTDYVESADAASAQAAVSAGGMDLSWQGVIKTLTASASPTKIAAANAEDLATQVEDVGLNADLAAVGLDAMAERASAFSKSLESSTNIDDLLSSGLSYRGGLDGFFEKIGALPKELDVAKVALGGYTDAQHDALAVLSRAGDASQKYLTSLLEQGLGADNVRVMSAAMWDQYRKVFEQLGLNEEQTRQYQEVLGLTDDQVETAITLSGLDEAIFKIEAYGNLLKDDQAVPPVVQTQVLAQLAEDDLIGAAETYDNWVRFMQGMAAANPIDQPVEADTAPATAGLETWRSLTRQAPPADTQVGANTDPATSEVWVWRQLQEAMAVEVPIKAKIDGSWRGVIGSLTGAASKSQAPQYVPSFDKPYPGANGMGGQDLNFLTPRAMGGPVNPNDTYLVGERGPEVFRPKVAGDIIPNHQIGAAAQQAPTTIREGHTFNIQSTDPVRTALEVVRRDRDAEFLWG